MHVFVQSGLIHSKAMPQLVLSRSKHAVRVKYADAPVEGYPVVIAKRYNGLILLLFLCLQTLLYEQSLKFYGR